MARKVFNVLIVVGLLIETSYLSFSFSFISNQEFNSHSNVTNNQITERD